MQEASFRFPDAHIVGYDVDHSVVQRAKQRFENRTEVYSDAWPCISCMKETTHCKHFLNNFGYLALSESLFQAGCKKC